MGTLVFQATLGGSVNLIGPNTASTINFTLPSADGTSGQALTTNGSGTLSFSSFATLGSNTFTGSQTLSAGTANGVTYLNGSKVLTSGSTLTFDGNQIAVTPVSGNAVSKLFGGTGAGVGSYFAVYAQGANSGYFGTDSGVTGSGTSNDLTIYPASTNNIRFYQSGAEQMRLTSTGLGIGTSSPAFKLDVAAARATSRVTSTTGTNAVDSQVVNSGGTLITGIDSSSGGSLFGVGAYAAGLWYTGAYPLVFGTNNTERARFDSSGRLLVGITSVYNGSCTYQQRTAVDSNQVFSLSNSSTSTPYIAYFEYPNATPNNTGSYFLQCNDATANRFQLRSNGGIANYSANNVNLSDRREKTNFSPATSYLDKICAIPVQTFNYIDQNLEEDDGLTLGVVAQDVQAVAPELVTESNWGTEEEPKMRLSIYQTDLQYALMKALQELKAEFDAYKASHP